jgi:hypothetical protein
MSAPAHDTKAAAWSMVALVRGTSDGGQPSRDGLLRRLGWAMARRFERERGLTGEIVQCLWYDGEV